MAAVATEPVCLSDGADPFLLRHDSIGIQF